MKRKLGPLCVCLAAVFLASCRAGGGAVMGAAGVPAQNVRSTQDAVEYDGVQYTASGPPQFMDILSPKPSGRRLPIVLCIHGGAWTYGSRGDMRNAMTWLQGRGYCACSIDYRLAQTAPFPAQIQDCKCAVRYLRAHADALHIDPNRIGVLGLSAGGHLGLLLGLTPALPELEGTGGWGHESSKVQCVVDLEGPTDFTVQSSRVTIAPENLKVVETLLGGPLETHRAAAAAASPITYVKKGDPPTLIMQGDRDTLVPVSQSQALYSRMKASGDDVTLRIIKGLGHGALEQFAAPDNVALTNQFLDRVLK